MIRSALALIAAVWFAYNAFAFLPAVGVHPNEAQVGGFDGEDAALAVTWAARTLFGGLALLSMAVVDWEWLGRSIRSLFLAESAPSNQTER